MTKFSYKFDSIKKVKETLEKQAQKEVAEIEFQIDRKRNDYLQILEDATAARVDTSYKKLSISDLKFIKAYEKEIEHKLSVVQEEITQLESAKEKKMEQLLQKSKEYKIFEKLKDNHFELFKDEENKTELDMVNEMAANSFRRGKE